MNGCVHLSKFRYILSSFLSLCVRFYVVIFLENKQYKKISLNEINAGFYGGFLPLVAISGTAVLVSHLNPQVPACSKPTVISVIEVWSMTVSDHRSVILYCLISEKCISHIQ